jgi:citrate lyase subunit beta/citryl-CoA lyase
MVEKARDIPADLVFLDLEDSVAPAAKADARALVAAALGGPPFRAATLAVRVNRVGGPWCHRDLIEGVGAAPGRVDVVILPKVASPGEVAFADHLLAGIEQDAGIAPGAIGLEVQIEDPAGLVAAEALAACCPRRMEALVFGPGDFAAAAGMPTTSIGGEVPGYPGDALHHALSRILVAARAAGLQAVDGPFAGIHDPDGLRASARRARALGYDGKWSVHPAQVPVLNEVFGVAPEDLERARAVLAAVGAAEEQGRGAAVHAGEMIDEATRRMAAQVVERARLAGYPERPTAAAT